MKWALIAVLFFLSSCAEKRDSVTTGIKPTMDFNTQFTYSVVGKRLLDINPAVWSNKNLDDPAVVCEQFGSAGVALVRVRHLISKSTKIAAIENKMFLSKNYLILSDQLRSEDQTQRRVAADLIQDAKNIVKSQISAVIEDALTKGMKSIDTSGFNYVVLGDYYQRSYSICPKLFILEKGFITYIDHTQKI